MLDLKKIFVKCFLFTLIVFGISQACNALETSKITVYYFYGKPRCITCNKIEAYTKASVETLKDKNVIFIAIDMDKAENKNMVKKYNLFTKSVVLTKTKAGKQEWKNLDKIWLKVGKEQDFKTYIIEEIKMFKGAK